MVRFRSLGLTAAVGAILALSACGNGAPATSSSGGGGGGASVGTAAASGLGSPAATVQQTAQLKFDPATTNLKVGQVIEWTNGSSVPHNVTFDNYPSLSSQTMQQGDKWEVKFTTPGTYSYRCTFHPGMDGTITVT